MEVIALLASVALLTAIDIIIIEKIIYAFRFRNLIKSPRYKNSIYQVRKYGNEYVLHNIKTGRNVSLRNIENEYDSNTSYSVLGNKEKIVKAFNQLVPIIF